VFDSFFYRGLEQRFGENSWQFDISGLIEWVLLTDECGRWSFLCVARSG
jgi:hypothetical protein